MWNLGFGDDRVETRRRLQHSNRNPLLVDCSREISEGLLSMRTQDSPGTKNRSSLWRLESARGGKLSRHSCKKEDH